MVVHACRLSSQVRGKDDRKFNLIFSYMHKLKASLGYENLLKRGGREQDARWDSQVTNSQSHRLTLAVVSMCSGSALNSKRVEARSFREQPQI